MSYSIGTLVGYLELNDRMTSGVLAAQKTLYASEAKFKTIGKTISMGVSAPLLAAGAAAMHYARDFQGSMMKIETLVGVNRKQVDAWREDIVRIAGEVGKAPKELADAMFFVTSSGERGANALKILEEAGKASAIGLGDTGVIARAVTGAMQAYKSSNLDAAQATRIMIATVQEGNLSSEDLAGSLGRVMGISAQAGVKFQELGAFIATFTRLGVGAEEAVTALRGILSTTIKPTQQARDALAALRDPLTGAAYSVDRLRESIREKGLTQTLLDLKTMVGDNADALGMVVPNMRALSGFLGTAGSQGKAFTSIIKTMNEAAGDADFTNKRFARSAETLGHTLEVAKAKAMGMAILIGTALVPIFTKAIEATLPLINVLTGLARGFVVLPSVIQSTTLGLIGFAAVAGPLVLLTSKLIGFYAGVLPVLAVLGNTIPMLTARLWLLNAAQTAVGAAALMTMQAIGLLAAGVASFWATMKVMDWTGWSRGIEYAYLRLGQLVGIVEGHATKADLWNSVLENERRRHEGAGRAAGQHAEAVQRLADEISGKNLADRVNELTDAVAALTDEQLRNPDVSGRMKEQLQTLLAAGAVLTPKLRELAVGLKLVNDQKNSGSMASLSEQYATARKEISGWSRATRENILAGIRMNKSANDIAMMLSGVTSSAVELFTEDTRKATQAMQAAISPLKEIKDKVGELTSVYMAYANLVGGQTMRSEWIEENADAILKAERNAKALGVTLPLAFRVAAQEAQKYKTAELFKEMNANTTALAWEAGQKQIEDARRIAAAKNQAVQEGTAALVAAQRVAAQEQATLGMGYLERELAQIRWAAEEKKRQLEAAGALTSDALRSIDLETGRSMAKAVDAYTQGIAEMQAATQSWGKVLGALFADIPGILQQAFTGGGGAVGAMKAVGSKLGSGLLGNLFGDVSGFGNKIASGAQKLFGTGFAVKLGKLLPNMLPGLGSAVGALAGPLLAKLFGPSKGKQEGMAADAEISKLQSSLLKTYGNLDRIRVMGGAVGVALADAWGDRNVKGLEHFKQAMDEFEAKQKELQSALDKYGLSWLDLGADMRALKFGEMAGSLLGEFKLLTGAGADPGKVVKGMGGALSQLIVDAVRAGQKIPAALEPVLKQLIEVGGLSGAAANALLGIEEKATPSLADVEAAAKRYGLTLDQLGPKVQGLRVNEAAAQIVADFNTLTSASVDFGVIFSDTFVDANGEALKAGDAVNGMRQRVQDLVNQSLALGLELPASMKPVLQAMLDAGKLTDAAGTKLTDLSGLNFAEPITESVDRLIAKMSELIDRISGGVVDAIDKIPREVNVDLRIRTSDEQNSADEYHHGGVARMHDGGFLARAIRAHDGMLLGRGEVPIIAKEGEGILSNDVGMPSLGRWALEALNSGRAWKGAQGGFKQTIIIERDSREEAKRSVEHLIPELRVRGALGY